MTASRAVQAWAAALLLAPSLARAQAAVPAWDSNLFESLKARLAETAAPPVPASQPAPQKPDDPIRKLFQHPLILGASVSAGYRAESPARKIARRFGTQDAVVSLAAPGASGAREVERLTAQDLASATVVVGVDLFFWDSRRDCQAGIAAVDQLFKKVKASGTPIVLANVPAPRSLLGDSCPETLNRRIAQACAEDKTCALLDLDALYARAAAQGADLDGRHYTLHELQPDGLHLSDAGSELMARAILDALAKTRPPSN